MVVKPSLASAVSLASDLLSNGACLTLSDGQPRTEGGDINFHKVALICIYRVGGACMIGCVEKLDAHTFCASFKATYKEPRNDTAMCPFVREETDRSPQNIEAEGGTISNSNSRMCQHAILSSRPLEVGYLAVDLPVTPVTPA